MPERSPRIVIVGGGAAGFFAAIACRKLNPAAEVQILERGPAPLSKVRISGGGRCNVTHDQPDPRHLIEFYPRGGKALRGPFTRFGPRETIAWFKENGVTLKTEADGRMFPTTDDSATVISTLVGAAEEAGVNIRLRTAAVNVEHSDAGFTVTLRDGSTIRADRVLLATGGAPATWKWSAALGHTIQPPVPSLFTFNIEDPRLDGLAGVSVEQVRLLLEGTKENHEGPLLVTHWGLSGPAVLRASAWGARPLHESGYNLGLTVNWRPDLNCEQVLETLRNSKEEEARRTLVGAGPFGLPQRLWRSLAGAAGAAEDLRWADASRALLNALAAEVHEGVFRISGKGVFKEEFVTCGGVDLREVNFRTMESRVLPGLHFAGEVLDIDGITGGFNFQSAWTTGWLAGQALAGGN